MIKIMNKFVIVCLFKVLYFDLLIFQRKVVFENSSKKLKQADFIVYKISVVKNCLY